MDDLAITRTRRGRGFEYTLGGRTLGGADVERIKALKIPPAWADVEIAAEPGAALQARGRDQAGRLQYLYHTEYRAAQERAKFEHMVEFGHSIEKLRDLVSADIRHKDVERSRVLACGVGLLDVGFFRVGNEEYASDEGGIGLATLRREQVRVHRGSIEFEYNAKSGVHRHLVVQAPELEPTLKSLRRRRGGIELLAYKENGTWRDVTASDINEYIRRVGPFSAKDFRTWHASVLAAGILGVARVGGGRGSQVITNMVREVAAYMGNTPAVCRAHYIDPRIVDAFERGKAVDPSRLGTVPGLATRGIEAGVLELLS